MFNKAILMGRIAHNLELKTTQGGLSVLSFRIAVGQGVSGAGRGTQDGFFQYWCLEKHGRVYFQIFFKGKNDYGGRRASDKAVC